MRRARGAVNPVAAVRVRGYRGAMIRLPRRAAALSALPVLPVLALLAACASPEAQLRTGLVNAGLSEPVARCMAHPMVEQLSMNQLLKLRSLGKLPQTDLRRTSYDQFMHRLRALEDPVILRVTAGAALGCALG